MRFVPVASGRGRTQATLSGNTYSIVHSWRSGKTALPNFPALSNAPIPDSNFVLRIEKCIPLHEAANLPDQHFETAWQKARDYVDQCRNHLGLPDYRQLTQELVDRLDRDILEAPPESCYPLYFMTVCKPIRSVELVAMGQRIEHSHFYMRLPDAESSERVVYVGKTFARHRFENGHHAITKLLRPQYEGLEKWLYLARLVYRQAGGTELPLEWIHEEQLATRLLASAEGQLIFSFDPELNDRDEAIRHPKDFAVLNLANRASVLKDSLVFVNAQPFVQLFGGDNVVGQ